MHDAGWTAYSRLHASHSEDADSRDMEFIRNGTIARVSIQKSQDDPSTYHVQHSGYPTLNALPIPRDSGFVEFDGSTSPQLVAATAMNLDETRQFYETAMPLWGWIPTQHIQAKGQDAKDEFIWLTYLRGQQDLVMGLERRTDGRTLIRVGERLENSSWQLAKPESPAASEGSQVGIEAADIPILNQGGTAKYDSNEKRIEFQIQSTSLSTVAEKYTAEFAKYEFTPNESGIRAEDYTFLTFSKDDVEIDLRARNLNGNAQVIISGDGLLWTKPLPGPKTVISYESWLRQHRHPAGLGLLDQYINEMRSLGQ
jgi:hypothetical protein